MKIRYATYKTYSGLVVKNDQYPVVQADFDMSRHMHRATWLAAELEGPLWGTVQSYDGAGISCGLFHWIGRYRNGQQGPLFQLLRRMELAKEGDAPGSDFRLAAARIWADLATVGWYVAQDGKLRSLEDGSIVSGNAFRDAVAPRHGKVPRRGELRERAQGWAVAFHKLFAHGRRAQARFAVDYLVQGQSDFELAAYRRELGDDVETPEPLLYDRMSERLELAMCVYHSHSVNAPGAAVSCLRQALRAKDLPKALVRALGKKKYGAWKRRYARTRRAAMESLLWPDDLFVGKDAIMPARLE